MGYFKTYFKVFYWVSVNFFFQVFSSIGFLFDIFLRFLFNSVFIIVFRCFFSIEFLSKVFVLSFNSQLNTSGREPTTFDTPVTHSIDTPTHELKVL